MTNEDAQRRACPGLKPAWMLGSSRYIYKKKYPLYIYIFSFSRVCIRPRLLVALSPLLRLIAGGYHNALPRVAG